jgi:hypothetical protein
MQVKNLWIKFISSLSVEEIEENWSELENCSYMKKEFIEYLWNTWIPHISCFVKVFNCNLCFCFYINSIILKIISHLGLYPLLALKVHTLF